jgi:hypothetical protein
MASIKGILDESAKAIASEVKDLISSKNDIEAQIEDYDRQLANVPDAEAIALVINEEREGQAKEAGG